MSIKISPDKMKNLESASLIIDSLRLKMANMNDSILADFDILAKSVTDIVSAHSYEKRMEASHCNFFNPDHQQYRLNYYMATYLCIDEKTDVHRSPHWSGNIERQFFTVDNVIIDGKKEFANCTMSTLELWIWADRRLAKNDDYIICIDDIKRIPNTEDYEIIYSLF